MKRDPFLLVLIVMCLLTVRCTGRPTSAGSVDVPASPPEAANVTEVKEKIVEVETTLSAGTVSPWKVLEKQTAGRENLRSVFFLDPLNGWAGGQDVVYRTDDGGTSWRPLTLGVSKRAYVISVVFRDENNGWVVAQEEAVDALTIHEQRFWLMRTSDGGLTWKTQLDVKNSVAHNLRVTGEGEGWLVGVNYMNAKPLKGRNLVLHSTDSGEHWVNMAPSLDEELAAVPISDSPMDVLPEGPLTASVVLPVGTVFRTTDGGKNWHQLNGTIDIQIGSNRLGIADGERRWVAGYQDPGRIISGMLAVDDGDSWSHYVLPFISFFDVTFFSRSQILTVGSTTPGQKAEKEEREAVVSYSSDGGSTWSFIYHNRKVRRIRALAVVDQQQVWAVGDDGLILQLTR